MYKLCISKKYQIYGFGKILKSSFHYCIVMLFEKKNSVYLLNEHRGEAVFRKHLQEHDRKVDLSS